MDWDLFGQIVLLILIGVAINQMFGWWIPRR